MSYIGNEPGLGVAERYLFSPSGSGTVVSVDDTGLSIAYTVNQVSVYLNGVKQVIGTGKDVTATNGTSITFLSAYASGDVIEIIALSSFSPANTVPKTGGSFTGNVIHEADLRAGTIKSENGTNAITITDITGAVAYAGPVTVPTPTAIGHATTKAYVDAAAGEGGGFKTNMHLSWVLGG